MSKIPKKYTIDNAKNDIQNLQSQNLYDFQEIKRLDSLFKEYDKVILQAINFNELINKKIQSQISLILDRIKNLEDNSPSSEDNSSSSNGSGLTITQTNQLNTAYKHSQSPHVKTSDIPIKTSQLTNDSKFTTETYVTNAINKAQLSGGDCDFTSEQQQQLNKAYNHSQSPHVKNSDIPIKTSQLTNDSKFATETYVTNAINNAQLSGGDCDFTSEQQQQLNTAYNHSQNPHVKTSDIPIKTSQLTNDSDFASKTYVTNAINNAQLGGGNTDVDLSIYQLIQDNTLTTTAKTIPAAINELKSGLNGITVPTKTSELINNSGFISSIPSEYITETELNGKGYLTSHQDISNLQNKTDNGLTTTNKSIIGAINELNDEIQTQISLILDRIKNLEDNSPSTPSVKTYSVTYNLNNVTSSNNKTTITENSSYATSLTPYDNYVMSYVSVSVGGVNVTDSVYSNGVIIIDNVSGNIEISVTAILQENTIVKCKNAGLASTDGKEMSSTIRIATDFIPVTISGQLSICSNTNEKYLFLVRFYDVNKNFVGAGKSTWSAHGVTDYFTANDDVKFIRLLFKSSMNDNETIKTISGTLEIGEGNIKTLSMMNY